jgi:ankyrin repeat protein
VEIFPMEAQIKHLVSKYPNLAVVQDASGRLALDVAPPVIKTAILSVSTEFSEEALKSNDFALWFYLLQVPAEIFPVESQLKRLISKYPDLAEIQDASGRLALDVATPVNKTAILSMSTEFSEKALKSNNWALWYYLLLVPVEIFSMEAQIKHLVSKYPEIANNSFHLAFEKKQTDIILVLLEIGADLKKKDSQGRTAIECCPEEFKSDFLSIPFSEEALKQHNYALWFHIVQFPDETPCLEAQIKRIVLAFPRLVEAQDELRRNILDVATPSNKRVINSVLLVHGRYHFVYIPIINHAHRKILEIIL